MMRISTLSRSGCALKAGLDVRIIQEVRKLAGDLDVLLVAIGPHPPVALGAITLAQGVRIESQIGVFRPWLPLRPWRFLVFLLRTAI